MKPSMAFYYKILWGYNFSSINLTLRKLLAGGNLMKIMISHIPNTFNYGSAMMAINLIYYLNKKFNDNVQFFVDTRTKEDIENLINCTGITNIEVNKILPDKSKLMLQGKDVNLDIDWINAYCDGIISNYDCFVVLGGDDLSEYYSKEYMVNELYKINKISSSIPVFLLGQTIGPFTEWRKDYAARMLQGVNIYTRDSITYNYLIEELKLEDKYIKQSADLAFLELPNEKGFDSLNLLNQFELKENKYITIVPSGLGLHKNYYTDNPNSYVYNWLRVIRYIIDKKNLKVVLLPHVLRPERSSDKLAIEEILRKIDKNYFKNIVHVDDDFFLPLKSRILLGNSKLTITGRMHPAISTFELGKPSISISYSVKYKGVLGVGLDCKDLIIESTNDIWKNNKVGEIIIEKIEYVMDNYNNITEKINYNVRNRKKEVFNMIDEVHRYITGGKNE